MMVKKEAKILLRVVAEHLQIFGKCQLLAVGRGEIEACNCPICQLERIDVDKLQEVVKDRYYRYSSEELNKMDNIAYNTDIGELLKGDQA